MKDDRLEKEFEEYFKGVNIPDDITGDAKKSVKPRRKISPKFVKFASIAASIVLVFAVSLTVILKTDFNKVSDKVTSSDNSSAPDASGNNGSAGAPDVGNSGNEGGVPDFSGGGQSGDNPSAGGPSGGAAGDSSAGGARFEYYTDGDLTITDEDPSSISSLNSSLKIIEDLIIDYNADVEYCKAGYSDDKLALVKAKINMDDGLAREDATVFVEFTDEDLIYEGLDDYYKGSARNYYGTPYYFTQTISQSGEYEFKLQISYKGVKYYFDVLTSDIKGYEKYLNLVTNK